MKVESFGKRLLVYGVGAGAASVGASAHATIVSYSGPPVTGNNIYFSLNGSAPTTTDPGGTEDFSLNSNSGKFIIVKYGNTAVTGVSSGSGFVSPTTNGYPSELAAGTTIGPGSVFRTNVGAALHGQANIGGPSTPYGYWTVGSTGFLGLKIVTPSNQTDYGWAELVVNGTPPADGPIDPGADYLTLDAYAFDDSGAPILAGDFESVGAVPEPNCAGWLAAGAAGLSLLRARRKK